MLQKMIIGICLLCIQLIGYTQMEVTYNNQFINYSTSNIQFAFSNEAQFKQNATIEVLKNGWQPLLSNKIDLLQTPYSFWLKIPVQSILQYGDFELMNIQNPHINFLKCWIIYKDSIVREYPLTGDNIHFSSRPLPTPSFTFHISSSTYKDCSIVLVTDKKYTRLDVPIHFYSSTKYIATIQKQNLKIGLFLGVGFFLLIFNSYLFISLKQTLYLWYSIYLFIITLYVCTDFGLLFNYIYPNFPRVNDVIRPSMFALSSFPLMFFFNNLLEIEKNFPKLYSFNKIILVVYLLLVTLAISTSIGGNYQIQGFWVKMNRIIGPIVLVVVVIESFYCWFKRIRFAIFSVLSFTSFFIFIFIYSLHQNALIPQNNFTATANYWGIVFEALIIAFSLAWRYKLYKQDSERLLKENIAQQNLIFKETAIWQEKEMQRISTLLHDTVGANLGFLRLATDNMPLTEEGKKQIADHITQLSNEVRNMSHSFSPIVLQDKGLHKAVEDFIRNVRNNSLINVQFEWLGDRKEINLQYQIIIYRIVQELMQNMIKHANANNAFVQILIEDDLVSIYVEDDGIGLQNDKPHYDGIGLKSIENLVTSLKGNIRIDSSANEGFSISIEFQLHENEKL